MAYKPLIKVIDLTTGLDWTSTTATVRLRPFGNVSGEINCSRLATSNSYYADSDIDESKQYHVMVDVGSGFLKRGVVFDENVGVDKITAVEAF